MASEETQNANPLLDSDFLNMPDDCVLEIFEKLNQEDLFSVAVTDDRLKSLAQRVWSGKHSHFHIGNDQFFSIQNIVNVKKALEYFGSSIESLELDWYKSTEDQEREILQAIAANCGEKLKSFCWNYSCLEGQLIEGESDPLLNIFRYLEDLTLKRCEIDVEEVLKVANNLKSLYLLIYPVSKLKASSLPQLEKITLVVCDSLEDEDIDELKNFFKENSQLKSIRTVNNSWWDEELETFASFTPNIEDFAFVDEGCQLPLGILKSFKKLRKLSLLCDHNQTKAALEELIDEEISLDELEIYGACSGTEIETIVKFTQLKVLKMDLKEYSEAQLLAIGEKLVELCELRVDTDYFTGTWKISIEAVRSFLAAANNLEILNLFVCDIPFDDESYMSCVQIIQNRESKKSLKIRYWFKEESSVSADLIQANIDVLEISG